MGAKSPANTRSSNRAFKCEFCGRKLISAEGLSSHLRSLHSLAMKEKEKTSAKKKAPTPKATTTPKTANTPKVTPKNTKEVKEVRKNANDADVPQSEKQTIENRVPKDKQEAKSGLKSAKNRKVEFKCPKCDKLFPVFFSAQRHIQKYHCINAAGQKVNPNSPHIIQPISTEICTRCNLKFTDSHFCSFPSVLKAGYSYQCIDCQQKLPNMKLFHIHVASMHSAGLENMFFPTKQEFDKWLDQMESQTHAKYVVMAQYMAKHIHCCSFTHEDTAEDTFQLCPSIITYQELSKGIQVHYYSNHIGHDTKPYTLAKDYKPYCITDLVEQATSSHFPDGDLYQQFRNLMENIIIDASNTNIETLRVLINKAAEMTTILTQEDIKLDEQKVKALSGSKRKYSNSESDSVTTSPKVPKRKVFSMANDKDSANILKELGDNKSGLVTPKICQSPSFNDSYKEFIGKAVVEVKKTTKKKAVVKTKMGQFKPGLSPKKSPKKAATNSARKSDIVYEVVEQPNDCNILVLKI